MNMNLFYKSMYHNLLFLIKTEGFKVNIGFSDLNKKFQNKIEQQFL